VHQFTPGVSFSANLGAGYDAVNKPAAVVASYSGDPNATAFTTFGLVQSRWIDHGGLGLTTKLNSGLELNLRYDAEHRTGFMNQTASAKLRWLF
jgi:hypothetical protein